MKVWSSYEFEENMEDILNIDAEVVSKPSKPVPPKVDKDDRTRTMSILVENCIHS